MNNSYQKWPDIHPNVAKPSEGSDVFKMRDGQNYTEFYYFP